MYYILYVCATEFIGALGGSGIDIPSKFGFPQFMEWMDMNLTQDISLWGHSNLVDDIVSLSIMNIQCYDVTQLL